MRRRWIGRRLVDVVVFVVFIAGVAKLYDLPAFSDSLATWRYVPRPLVSPIAFGLPLLELALAALWFLRLSPRVAVVGVTGLLFTFTAFYIYHTRDPGPPPDCGCLGLIIRFEAQQSAIFGLVTRNATLLLLIVAGAWLGGVFRMPTPWETRTDVAPTSVASLPAPGPSARAFTLLELLLVIAIVALLLSLLLPVLGGVREQAREARSLANLRSHATAMTTYTGDWDGQYLAMTDPRLDETAVVVNGRTYRLSYWAPTVLWPLGMLDEYYGGQMTDQSLLESRGDHAEEWGNWAYRYSSSFLARPGFWNPEEREGVHQLGPVRLHEVAYPTRKGLIVLFQDLPLSDYQRGRSDRRYRIGFADTSARAVRQGDLTGGYTSGEGDYASGGGSVGFPVTHTIDGVRGFDVR